MSSAGENLGPSQVFSKHAHSLELEHGLDSQECQIISLLSLFSQAFWLICCLPSCFLLPLAAVANILASESFQ